MGWRDFRIVATPAVSIRLPLAAEGSRFDVSRGRLIEHDSVEEHVRLTNDDGPGNAGPASARISAGAGDAILARAGRYQSDLVAVGRRNHKEHRLKWSVTQVTRAAMNAEADRRADASPATASGRERSM